MPSDWYPTNSTVLFGSGNAGREMMQHAAAGGHAARGDDDRRASLDATSAIDSCADATTVIRAVPKTADVALAVDFMPGSSSLHALGIELQRAGRHRAVDVDRQHRNPLASARAACSQYSTSSTRPTANDGMISLPPRFDRLVDDRRQPRTAVVGLVQPVAVGRLEQQHVGALDRRRVRQHGPAVAAEVAAEQHRLVADPESRVGRPEQMTGIDELDLHAGHDRHRTVVADRLKLRQRPRRVELGIERQRGRVLRIAVPVRLARVFFLNVRGIGQDERAQIARARRAEDAAAESAGDQPRQVAAMIEVRMRQDDRVDPPRDRSEARPSSVRAAPSAPETARNPPARGDPQVQQMLRPGDGAGGAEKRQRGHPMTILEVMASIRRRTIHRGDPVLASEPHREASASPARFAGVLGPLLIGLLIVGATNFAYAQQRLLTIDDIYDPGRRVNFSGNPRPRSPGSTAPTTRGARTARGGVDWLKVDAATGSQTPLFDPARWKRRWSGFPASAATRRDALVAFAIAHLQRGTHRGGAAQSPTISTTIHSTTGGRSA